MLTGSSSTALPVYNPGVTVDATTTLETGGSPDWHGRAVVCRWSKGDNRLLLVNERSSAHATNDGALQIKFSDDDGATWTAYNTKLGGGAVSGFPMTPTGATANQDPGEGWLIELPSGRILLTMWRVDYSTDNDGTQYSWSDDGGETWTTPAAIAVSGVTNLVLTYATDQGFVDPETGTLYAITREYTTGTYTACRIHLITSTDDGATWTVVSTVMESNQGGNGSIEGGMEYLGDRTILVQMRDTDHVAAWQRISTDMGATWGTLTDVTAQVGIAARQRIYTFAHLMGLPGWWNDHRLLMVGFVQQTPGDSQDRRNAVWVGSWDRNSATVAWDGPHYVDSSTEDAGYGDLFYAGAAGQFSVVNYQGTLAAAAIKQYDLTVELT